jgi:hypothetical protein
MQYSVCARSAMAKDSFAQSIGSESVQLSILAGVIDFNSSVAASPTSSRTALSTRQVPATVGMVAQLVGSWGSDAFTTDKITSL